MQLAAKLITANDPMFTMSAPILCQKQIGPQKIKTEHFQNPDLLYET